MCIVVGAGLAGLVAACELVERGRRVLIVDQENAANLGGQAFWSFGGLFFVDSPEQRRLGIRDSHELALQDWLGTAGFDRPEDHWPRQWAHAYVDFAAGEKRSWLRERGLQDLPARRLGRARRLRRTRARQLGAALPHHLGHRARRSSRSSPGGCWAIDRVTLRASAPRRRADRRGRRGRRRAGRRAGADGRGARGGVVAKRRRRVRVPCAGGDRRQRRHRR